MCFWHNSRNQLSKRTEKNDSGFIRVRKIELKKNYAHFHEHLSHTQRKAMVIQELHKNLIVQQIVYIQQSLERYYFLTYSFNFIRSLMIKVESLL